MSEKRKKKLKSKNLSLILWLSFSVFAVIVIAVYVLVQNAVINQRYREKMIIELREAGMTMTDVIYQRPDMGEEALSRYLFEISNRYGVTARLITADGGAAFPVTEETDFAEVTAVLREKFEVNGGRGEIVFESGADEIAFASVVSFRGEPYYLYVTDSLQSMGELTEDLQMRSLITGSVAVVLAFVVSGFVSMLITKPVVEVTEKAKELARGNYDVNFKENYVYTEICELSDALDYASSEISKADKMQKELIANVSHDFKTPLTMIKAYASMIQEISGNDPEKRAKHTQVIIDESDRLTALVNDLLDLSKIRSGINEVKPVIFNLSEYLYRIVDRFGYLTLTQGYVIRTEVEENLYTRADREKIGQVLYNLIGNAVNYTGEDRTITVRLFSRGAFVRFEVVDTGNGIPKEEISTIWERYYRSSEMHKRPVKGTGLGLSIVKSTLDKHRFRFGVVSEVGKGSCFWVDFPVPPEGSKEDAAPASANGTSDGAVSSSDKKKSE